MIVTLAVERALESTATLTSAVKNGCWVPRSGGKSFARKGMEKPMAARQVATITWRKVWARTVFAT